MADLLGLHGKQISKYDLDSFDLREIRQIAIHASKSLDDTVDKRVVHESPYGFEALHIEFRNFEDLLTHVGFELQYKFLIPVHHGDLALRVRNMPNYPQRRLLTDKAQLGRLNSN